jgi:ABC-type bacteriocin/lantibiotic exporter with double-glycine peptidase domain
VSGAFEATLLTGREGGAVVGQRIEADGRSVEVRGPLDEFCPVPGSTAAEEILCLLPVGVAPLVSAAGTEEPHEHLPPLSRVLQVLRREKRDVWLVWLYAILVGLFGLALPLGVQGIIQLVQGNMLLQPVVLLVGFVVAGSLASGGLSIMQMTVVELVQQRIFARMAFEFAWKVPQVRTEVAVRENLPEQMNRFFEVVNLQKALSKLLTDSVGAAVSIAFGLLLLMFYHPWFIAFAVLVLGVLVGIFWVTGRRGLETALTESKYKYKAVHWLEEMARALTAFKYAGRSNLPIGRMDELVAGYLKYRREHFKVVVTQATAIIVFKTIITGALLIAGILLVQDRQITLGQFVAIEIVIVTVLSSVEKLITSITTVYDTLVAVEKAGHVTDLPTEKRRGLPPRETGSAGMAVTLRDVGFRYEGALRPALDGISLDVRPGARVGITGFDGSGTSTFLQVLAGLYDGYHGAIAFDGITLRDLDQDALRGRIGQYLSRTDLFDGTIEENIAVGRPGIGTEQVLAALERVGLDEWVQGLPQGLRTPIINGGRGLPSNVAVRLLVAQAIVGPPGLLVIDDFLTNVEPASRGSLTQLLLDRAAGWTVIAASHDPAFLAQCDLVIVLKEGRIERAGTWAECQDDPVIRHLTQSAPAGAA